MLPSPDTLNDFEQGKFVLSNLAAKRAEQLIKGGTPLVRIDSTHPLTIALAEIAAGKITPRMPEGPGLATPDIELPTLTMDTGLLLPSLEDVDLDDELFDDHHEDEHEAEEYDADQTAIADLVSEEGGEEENSDADLSLSDLQEQEDIHDSESDEE